MANSTNRTQLINYLTGQQASAFGKNYVLNPSAFQNTSNVTVANSATVTRNTTTPLTAISDFTVSMPNNATGTVTWAMGTLDNAVKNQNCELRFDYTASSIGSNVVVQVLQGSSVAAQSSALTTQTNSTAVSLNVPCGDLSTATTFVIANGTGNTGTSAINIANITYGKATNIAQVAQAQFIGNAYIPATASCTWSRTNTALGSFGTTAACPGPTVDLNPGVNGGGIIQTTDTDLPKFTVNNLPAGTYQISISGPMSKSSATSRYDLAISDGTSTRGHQQWRFDTSGGDPDPAFNLIAHFTYTTAGNRTFELFGASTAGGTLTIDLQNTNARLNFNIVKFPSASEIIYTPTQTPSFWAGYHDNTCSWSRTNTAIGSFTADASCALVERTNTNFGTVSTSGGVLPAITFTPKTTGAYMVCVSGQEQGSATSANWTLQLFDGTTEIAQTGGTTDVGGNNSTFSFCGFYPVTTLTAKTIELRGRSSSGSLTIAPTGTTFPLEWQVIQLSPQIGHPQIINSVQTSTTTGEYVYRANLTCSGASAVNSQSGSWITSIGNVSAGKCTVTMPATSFPTTNYACNMTRNGTSVTSIVGFSINNKATTSFDVYMALISSGSSTIAAGTSETFDIICEGQK